jgi:predicted ATP-dependent endonuclease of OLD family
MKIKKIQIENYRLLKKFNLELEDELSLVIGKNNTGKTSILSILDKFLNQSDKNRFSFNDFNIEFKKELKTLVEDQNEVLDTDYKQEGIRLKLFVEYGPGDNLSNLSRVMMDLDPNNNFVVLGFEYTLGYEDYKLLRKDYVEFVQKENAKKAEDALYEVKGFFDLLQISHDKYFKPHKKSFSYDTATGKAHEDNYIDLKDEEISTKDIVNFKYINAKREVSNKEVKSLSGQTSRIYKRTESSNEQNAAIDKFKDRLTATDVQLSDIYKTLFDPIIQKVKDFGGIKTNESEIGIISTLQHRELLEGNTTVIYKHDADQQLPEHYNGLGYMNLISMIFEIEILVQEFKSEQDKKPSDINLLFVEEPEAHTHPQMQYVFIKNIKKLLKEGIKRKDGIHRELQYIISTHSSCIVAESDFDDIKYLKKENTNSVIAKNLKDLKTEYEVGTTQYQFLKQYLTISRAEIFFADKAILIEGDTERILIPTLMKKVDNEEKARFVAAGQADPVLPLLSQNVSVIEVGAYSQIFEKFIDFLGIKSLVITDLDAVDNTGEKCPVASGVGYSNAAIKYFFSDPTFQNLQGYAIANKTFNKVAGTWTNQADGKLCVVYQTLENTFNGRSFEDAFIHINRAFISPIKADFKGLQNRELFDDAGKTAYDLAADCIKKKTHFALDILYHSNEDLSNWTIPAYIKEGILWLKQD